MQYCMAHTLFSTAFGILFFFLQDAFMNIL